MVNLEVPHFSTAAPLSATRRTFQAPFTPLFDGRTSAQYHARLTELEAQAKKEKRGAWRFVK
jgi:hypothetical protein